MKLTGANMKHGVVAVACLACLLGGYFGGHRAGMASMRYVVQEQAFSVVYVYGEQPAAFLECVARGGRITQGPGAVAQAPAKLADFDVCTESVASVGDGE